MTHKVLSKVIYYSETLFKAPQAERDAVEAELNGVDGSAGETPDTENTPDTTNTGGDN
ncbi:hypothetical protein MH280_000062 [Salmonella enterica]|nr:hypothetical protein [Salmonella enterica]